MNTTQEDRVESIQEAEAITEAKDIREAEAITEVKDFLEGEVTTEDNREEPIEEVKIQH